MTDRARSSDGRLSEPATSVPGARTAWALSLAGALPFVVSALFLLIAGRESLWFDWALDVARTYGAVILSFVAGIRWGAALRARPVAFGAGDEGTGRTFFVSVIPSLAAWFSLLLEPIFGLAFLSAVFALQGVWDAYSGPRTFGPDTGTAPLPLWFVRLRVTITFIVVASLLLALVAVA